MLAHPVISSEWQPSFLYRQLELDAQYDQLEDADGWEQRVSGLSRLIALASTCSRRQVGKEPKTAVRKHNIQEVKLSATQKPLHQQYAPQEISQPVFVKL